MNGYNLASKIYSLIFILVYVPIRMVAILLENIAWQLLMIIFFVVMFFFMGTNTASYIKETGAFNAVDEMISKSWSNLIELVGMCFEALLE